VKNVDLAQTFKQMETNGVEHSNTTSKMHQLWRLRCRFDTRCKLASNIIVESSRLHRKSIICESEPKVVMGGTNAVLNKRTVQLKSTEDQSCQAHRERELKDAQSLHK